MEYLMSPDSKYMHPGEQVLTLLSQFDDTIQWYQRNGFEGFSRLRQKEQPKVIAKTEPLTLKQLEQKLQNCQQCKLHRGRTHVVFGAGNPRAILMFIGEGPGQQEDLSGRPFVGAAGQLLDKMLALARNG